LSCQFPGGSFFITDSEDLEDFTDFCGRTPTALSLTIGEILAILQSVIVLLKQIDFMELFSISLGLLFWTLLAIPIFLLWIFALVSVLRNDFEGNDKIVWLVLIIFLPFIGSILYFAIGRSKRVKIR
jgi:hypothetical protein